MAKATPCSKRVFGLTPTTNLAELPPRESNEIVILVADDDALMRNLVTLLMQRQGYYVLSAADGKEGLELSRKYPGPIELLVTDLAMPRLNGSDLCAHILKERPGIKVLMMSAADIQDIISQNINLPFLPKPFDGGVLVDRVRAILAAPSQEPLDLQPLNLASPCLL